MLSVGFVGAGRMGQLAHLRNYDRIDACEVVALAEPRERLRERVAQRYEIPDTYEDHQALLAGADVDAVVAAQPFQRHRHIVPDILETGTPVFTEKPLAASVAGGEEIVAAAEAHDTLHMVGYHKRSDPAMVRAREVTEEWRRTGHAGELRYVRITMPAGDWLDGAPDPVTTDEEPPEGEMEGPPDDLSPEAADAHGSFINFFIHQVNAFRHFFGDYEVTFADPKLMAVRSHEGVTGALEMDPYTSSDDWQERILVGFDEGYVRVELPAPLAVQEAGTVEILDDSERVTERPTMPNTAAMRAQAENFVAAAAGERDPPADSREALADLRVAREYIDRRF
ncbi:MAG: Gfo/Idh/MocA family protein [Halobacteriaceae archaeon]